MISFLFVSESLQCGMGEIMLAAANNKCVDKNKYSVHIINEPTGEICQKGSTITNHYNQYVVRGDDVFF